MSDSHDYKEKYEHNEEFVAFIQSEGNQKFPDWEIIVTFYAALHFMNLYLNKCFKKNISEISSHKKRNAYIKDNCTPEIAFLYKTMYDLSKEARYQYSDVSDKISFMKAKYLKLKALCQKSMASAIREKL